MKYTAIILAAALATAGEARAADVTIEIAEAAVDDYLGSLESSGKTHVITLWIDLWFTKVKIAQGPIAWKLRDLDIDFAPGDVTLSGKLDATYAGITQNDIDVAADATIGFDQTKRLVRVELGAMTVSIPLLGLYEYTTTIEAGVTLEYPLGSAGVMHPKPAGGLETISMSATNLSPSVEAGKLVLQGQVTSW
jgi:hypothetical protein